MVSPHAKQLLMASLVFCFAIQTFLVYSDEPGPVGLEGDALVGAELWHAHNCQACHQLYGFGGFLGPDLTNARSRLGEKGLAKRLEPLLRDGSGQMPAFGLGPTEAGQIAAFLGKMDQTGRGQLRAPRGEGVDWVLAKAGTSQAQMGVKALKERPCQACHRPFEAGVNGAPALASIPTSLSPEEIETVLVEGRPPLMPAPSPAFSAEERVAVVALWGWMEKERSAIEHLMGPRATFSFADVPWYEYDQGSHE